VALGREAIANHFEETEALMVGTPHRGDLLNIVLEEADRLLKVERDLRARW
jgi:hypothetical protein